MTHGRARSMTMLSVVLATLLSSARAPSNASPGGFAMVPVKKKLIAHGWEFNSLTPRDMPMFVEAMKDSPFDGVIMGFSARGERDDDIAQIWAVANGRRWKKAWFAEDIKALQQVRFGRFTDNFMRAAIAPVPQSWAPSVSRIAWTDDDRWEAVANNLGVLAWVAKQSGLKGLSLDPESYGGIRQYDYFPSDGEYDQAARLARTRGAQVMHAIAREYPDITLWAWLFSIKPQLVRTPTPGEIARQSGDLWTPFVNGMLDALPPTVRLVDSDKSYTFQGHDFLEEANRVHNQYLSLVAPESRDKYRRQVQVTFGVYVDAYANPEGSTYYFPPLNGSRANRLRQVLSEALLAADEYVWLYGERGCWQRWKTEHMDHADTPLWGAIIPDFARMIRLAAEPEVEGRREVEALRTKGKLADLATNPSFEGGLDEAGSSLPAAWMTWQQEGERSGVFSLATDLGFQSPSSAKAGGVQDGCFIQGVPVTPGEVYAVEALALPKGSSRCLLVVRWQTPDGRWTNEADDRQFCFIEPAGDWRKAFGVVSVPEGVGRMEILLSVSQPSPSDSCWFDQVGVHRLVGAQPRQP